MIIGQSQSQSVGEKILQEERDHGWQRGRLDLLAPTNQEDGEEEAEHIEVHC